MSEKREGGQPGSVPGKWRKHGNRSDAQIAAYLQENQGNPNLPAYLAGQARQPATPMLPVSLDKILKDDHAGAEFFRPTINHAQVMPFLSGRGTEERQNFSMQFPCEMEMYWDGRYPELLAYPMIWSTYRGALYPARYAWARNPDGTYSRGGVTIGYVRLDRQDYDLAIATSQGAVYSMAERSPFLFRAMGPAQKIGVNRYRVTAVPLTFPVYTGTVVYEFRRIGTECYVWTPPDPTSVGSDFPASYFNLDPLIYDMYELQYAFTRINLAVGDSSDQLFQVDSAAFGGFNGTFGYAPNNVAYGQTYRLLVARDYFNTVGFPSFAVRRAVVWAEGGFQLLGTVDDVVSPTKLNEFFRPATTLEATRWRDYKLTTPVYHWIRGVKDIDRVPSTWELVGTNVPANDYWLSVYPPSSPGIDKLVFWNVYRELKVTDWNFVAEGYPSFVLDANTFGGECRDIPPTLIGELVDEDEADPPGGLPPQETAPATGATSVSCSGSILYIFIPFGGGVSGTGWPAESGLPPATASDSGGGGGSGGSGPAGYWSSAAGATPCPSGCEALPPDVPGLYYGQIQEVFCTPIP